MESVKINVASNIPLYRQVAAEIRRAIANDEAKPGERLPLAKDLATVLGVNKNTVLRAMHELRDEDSWSSARAGASLWRNPGARCGHDQGERTRYIRSIAGYQSDELIAMIEAVS